VSRVTREIVTVLPDPVVGEVHVVVQGYRITLTAEETSLLARGLLNCLEQLRWAQRRDAEAETAITETSGRAAGSPDTRPGLTGENDAAMPIASPSGAASDVTQQRMRALIQATIRDKGLSLREERRS
jgi:hypothetical protein